ncbi:helix-turn-helix domain-containing protein [Clostridium tagluense]|uniref:helix-turn-helix domain-containing protein n=1 Tax=Clostridium tagluense TaxID=360422 RepID=UPI001C0DDC75|nr:helix-turn-helix transcriptional regulator [Clostridium tagluense]MBU3130188.1 helix-turn-helix transcriptional regulator [Clostridium tagluense]
MILKFKRSSRYAIKYTENQIYIKPHELLKPYISHYTVSFPDNSVVSDRLTLVPDASGCLVFKFDENAVDSLLWGATTKNVVVKNDVNDCPMRLFIEFLPSGLFYFTGVRQADLTDLRLSLWQVNNELHSLVVEAFERSKDLDHFIEMLNSILLPFIMEKKSLHTIPCAIEQLKQSHGMMSVKELSDLVHYSDRHLNRLFNDYIGMNIKTFSRLIRINTSIKQIKNRKKILYLSQNIGFYDQSHFIHDFKSICGVTPKSYFSNMSDFYNETLKF